MGGEIFSCYRIDKPAEGDEIKIETKYKLGEETHTFTGLVKKVAELSRGKGDSNVQLYWGNPIQDLDKLDESELASELCLYTLMEIHGKSVYVIGAQKGHEFLDLQLALLKELKTGERYVEITKNHSHYNVSFYERKPNGDFSHNSTFVKLNEKDEIWKVGVFREEPLEEEFLSEEEAWGKALDLARIVAETWSDDIRENIRNFNGRKI